MEKERLVDLKDLWIGERGQSQRTTVAEPERTPTHLNPAVADKVAVAVGDREEDDGRELTADVDAETDREARDGQRLSLDLDDRVVKRGLRRVAVIEQAGR